MKIKIETDRSLVWSPILRVRTARRDLYVWWRHGIRVAAYDRTDEQDEALS